MLDLYVVTPPIQEANGWLIYNGCQPHQCGNQILVAVDTNSENIVASISTGEDPLRIYITRSRGHENMPLCVLVGMTTIPAHLDCSY